jgi:cell division protein FtsZ
MKDAGPAWMSMGTASGKDRAVNAARQALASPLLDVSIQGAKGVLFNVVGGSSLTLFEVNEAAEIIRQAVDPEANIIFGVAHNPNMEEEVRITLIATGFISSLGISGTIHDDEIAQLLKNIRKSDDELDVPSFLRRPLFSHRRTMPSPDRAVKSPQSTPAHQS